MSIKLKAISERYTRYMTNVGRKRAAEALLLSSDRMLEDAGFSRELLQKGAAGWPWLAEEEAGNVSMSNAGYNESLVELNTTAASGTFGAVHASPERKHQREDRKVA